MLLRAATLELIGKTHWIEGGYILGEGSFLEIDHIVAVLPYGHEGSMIELTKARAVSEYDPEKIATIIEARRMEQRAAR